MLIVCARAIGTPSVTYRLRTALILIEERVIRGP
nr:MAG TPA: hypothetical protein [Caudoviricetes sp.]